MLFNFLNKNFCFNLAYDAIDKCVFFQEKSPGPVIDEFFQNFESLINSQAIKPPQIISITISLSNALQIIKIKLKKSFAHYNTDVINYVTAALNM